MLTVNVSYQHVSFTDFSSAEADDVFKIYVQKSLNHKAYFLSLIKHNYLKTKASIG